MLEKRACQGAEKGVPNGAISAAKLGDYFLHLLGLDWLGILLGFTVPLFQLFGTSSSQGFKSSDHLQVNVSFLFGTSCYGKYFYFLDVKHFLSLIEGWDPAISVTNLKPAWKTAKLVADIMGEWFDLT